MMVAAYALVVGCSGSSPGTAGGGEPAQDVPALVEEIEQLQEERLEVLRTAAAEAAAAAQEDPDSEPMQNLAVLALERLDDVTKVHVEVLEKLAETRREGNWEEAYPLLRLMINDGRPVAIVRALRDEAEANVGRAEALLERDRAAGERRRRMAAAQERQRLAAAAAQEERVAAAAASAARMEALVAAAPARRAEYEARLSAVEEVYEEMARIREATAQALTDRIKASWTRQQIVVDRWRMESDVGLAREQLERTGPLELDGVESTVRSVEETAARRLETVRAALEEAQGG